MRPPRAATRRVAAWPWSIRAAGDRGFPPPPTPLDLTATSRLLLLLLLLLRHLLLLLLLLKILRILVRRKLGVSRVRSKVTLPTVAVAVHGTRD